MIEIKDVSFSYGQTRVLQELALEITQGTFLAMMGANGSGKSTILKLVNAINTPDKGDVTVFGMNTGDPENTYEIRKKAGLVFQNPDNQIIASTVEEDIVFGMENIGMDRMAMKRKLSRIVEFAGLKGLEKKNPLMLSGGQKQRLAIASILVMEPEILLLDEPMSMLDPEGQLEIMQLLRKYHRANNTVILVTHDIEAALFAEKICLIRDGRVELMGSTPIVLPKLRHYREVEVTDWALGRVI